MMNVFDSLVHEVEFLKSSYKAVPGMDWEGSPFNWIKDLPAPTRGVVGEQLVERIVAGSGYSVKERSNNQHDRRIDGVNSEIKSSSLWKAGEYKFQQIRDQDYQLLLCFGFSPHDAHLWVFNKRFIIENVSRLPGLHCQHAGGKDTAWLSITPSNPSPWVRPFGGTLERGLISLRKELDAITNSTRRQFEAIA